MPLGWELWGTYLGKMSREGTSALEMSCSTKGCGSCEQWLWRKNGIPTKKSENLGQLFPRVSRWVWSHHSSRHLVFSYWEFGLFSSPRASKDWCDKAKVGEKHLDCWRASVWPTQLSICKPNLFKKGESLLKDRGIISWPEITLPHTSYRYFNPDEWYKCFCITLNFPFLIKKMQIPQTYSSTSGAWNWSCKLSIIACGIRSELTQLYVQT